MSLAFSRLSPIPVVQTLHHSPSAAEVALWSRYPEAPFVAISERTGAPAVRRERRRHGAARHRYRRFAFSETPDDYLLFLGRFTEGKGVPQAIDVAKRAGMKLILAAAEDDYYRETSRPSSTAPRSCTSARPTFAAKVKLYGGARALLYPMQTREPFGLVLAESMACGTPVAALDRGAVREVVDDGVTGFVVRFDRRDGRPPGRVFALESPSGARAGRPRSVSTAWSTNTWPPIDEFSRLAVSPADDPCSRAHRARGPRPPGR